MGPGALEPTLTSREYVWEKECAASFHLQVFIFWGGVDSGRGWWGGGRSQAMSWQVGKRQTWTCLYPRPLRVLRCKGGVWCSSPCHLKPSPAESGCKTSCTVVQLILTKCAPSAVRVCLYGVIRQTSSLLCSLAALLQSLHSVRDPLSTHLQYRTFCCDWMKTCLTLFHP